MNTTQNAATNAATQRIISNDRECIPMRHVATMTDGGSELWYCDKIAAYRLQLVVGDDQSGTLPRMGRTGRPYVELIIVAGDDQSAMMQACNTFCCWINLHNRPMREKLEVRHE
jgi:hypothetical protein